MAEGITGSIIHSGVRLPVVTGRRGLASLILSFLVKVIFDESQWRGPWRRLGVPVSVRRKGKEQESPVSEGCNGVWFCRSPQLADCRETEVHPLWQITRQVSGVGDE